MSKWGFFLFYFILNQASWAVTVTALKPSTSHVTCSYYDQPFCDVIETKEWSIEEKLFIENEISRLKSKGLSHILSGAFQAGTFHFARSTYGFSLDIFPDKPIKRETNQFAVTDKTRGWIIFFDLFFNFPIKIDPISQTDLKSHTFLHELVHAYDNNHQLALNLEFLNLAGFEASTHRPDFIKSQTNEREAIIQDIIQHKQNKRDFEAYVLEREYGISYGLPRLYSMTSPHEALADLVSHIFYDKNHTKYIHPELIRYADIHILRGARND